MFADSFEVVLVVGFNVPNPSLLKFTGNPSGIAPSTRDPKLSYNKSAVIIESSPILMFVEFALTVNTIHLTTSKFAYSSILWIGSIKVSSPPVVFCIYATTVIIYINPGHSIAYNSIRNLQSKYHHCR